MSDRRKTGNLSLSSAMFSRSAAFTLIELLVVIGIIAALVGILLPALFRSKKAGYIAKAHQDLQAIQMAVEAYQQAWGSYPPYIAGDAIYGSGSKSLWYTLMTARAKRANSEPYGPFLDRDKFNLTNNFLNDSDGNPILYFPAKIPVPSIVTTVNGGFLGDSTTALYDHRAGTNVPLADMQKIMGDTNANGMIDGAEAPAYTGPFILWGAGPDGNYGLNSKGKTDDVANFEIPGRYR